MAPFLVVETVYQYPTKPESYSCKADEVAKKDKYT